MARESNRIHDRRRTRKASHTTFTNNLRFLDRFTFNVITVTAMKAHVPALLALAAHFGLVLPHGMNPCGRTPKS